MKTLKMIDKILRCLVYAMYAGLLTLYGAYILMAYDISKTLDISYLDILFFIFILTLYFFVKNKRSQLRYNILLVLSGIIILFLRYYYWNIGKFSVPGPFINTIFSANSVCDLVPLSLIYLSIICTYFVSKKKNKELTQDKT
ncbi:hypothetical protein rsdtw13_34710 [Clostridium sp. TW13]|uniref:Uncharacterized protein n=1 Tax=Inconstantimicrobium mannanitabidum TaxID=1604901 RepID=A0ACB5RGR7_9CLOT|nr:hypothetical protein rsdtw13_34710 [Clostridium sp. TW13]